MSRTHHRRKPKGGFNALAAMWTWRRWHARFRKRSEELPLRDRRRLDQCGELDTLLEVPAPHWSWDDWV